MLRTSEGALRCRSLISPSEALLLGGSWGPHTGTDPVSWEGEVLCPGGQGEHFVFRLAS